jgi:hypothetical protein
LGIGKFRERVMGWSIGRLAVLIVVAPVVVVLSAPANACKIVGYKNGQPLCAPGTVPGLPAVRGNLPTGIPTAPVKLYDADGELRIPSVKGLNVGGLGRLNGTLKSVLEQIAD